MIKVGIILENTSVSQLAYCAIKKCNELVSEQEYDPIIFFENLSKVCLTPQCSMMQVQECWGFDGIVLATTLRNASRLTTFPSPTQKIYYVWDLDWLRPSMAKDFQTRYFIYSNKELKFVARSVSHADALKKCWGIKVEGIVDNVDIKEIINVCSNK